MASNTNLPWVASDTRSMCTELAKGRTVSEDREWLHHQFVYIIHIYKFFSHPDVHFEAPMLLHHQ